ASRRPRGAGQRPGRPAASAASARRPDRAAPAPGWAGGRRDGRGGMDVSAEHWPHVPERGRVGDEADEIWVVCGGAEQVQRAGGGRRWEGASVGRGCGRRPIQRAVACHDPRPPLFAVALTLWRLVHGCFPALLPLVCGALWSARARPSASASPVGAACTCWPKSTGVHQRLSKTRWVVTHFVTQAGDDHV